MIARKVKEKAIWEMPGSPLLKAKRIGFKMFHLKMSFTCTLIFVQIKLIFMRKTFERRQKEFRNAALLGNSPK